MGENRFLYFALGVLSVVSLGAITNQAAPVAFSTGVVLSETGITFPDGTVQTTAAPADPRIAFYMTSSTHNGAQTLSACGPGFHMASMWEIVDPSNLRYATDVEANGDVFRGADSGVGPPGGAHGWVRTGYQSFTASGEGSANCAVWTTSDPASYGSYVELENVWNLDGGPGDPSPVVMPWDSIASPCSNTFRVWCVEDYPGSAGG